MDTRTLAVRSDRLPRWVGDLTLTGLHAFGKRFDVHLSDGSVELEAAVEDSDTPVRG
jgi:hypothetical protein